MTIKIKGFSEFEDTSITFNSTTNLSEVNF